MSATENWTRPGTRQPISKFALLSAVLTLICFAGVASAQQPQRERPRPAGPGEIRLLEDPLDETQSGEPDKSPTYGTATSKRGGTDVWNPVKSAAYLKMVKEGQKNIVSITGRDPEGGYLWYRRILGIEIQATEDNEIVVAVKLGREYVKYVGPWDPENGEQPKHPFGKN